MELGYILTAVRRYWWLTLAVVLLGIGMSTAVAQRQSSLYQATALLQVGDSSDSFGSSSDRYIASQMVLLGSGPVLEAASTAIDGRLSAGEIRAALTYEQLAGTELVRVTTSSVDPQLAADVANAVVDSYVVTEADRQQVAAQRETAELDTTIQSLKDQLDDVDAEIKDVVEVYLPTTNQELQVIPSIEQINPELASQRSVLLDQYTNAVQARDELNRQLSQRFVGEVLEQAQAPTIPTAPWSMLIIAGGVMAGLAFGIAAAVIVARLSGKVLNDDQVASVLSSPVLGSLEGDPDRGGFPAAATRSADRRFVRQLCVQADSLATDGEQTTVVVAGASQYAGTTGLATLMAQRFAAQGTETLLVHAGPNRHDLADRWLAIDDTTEVHEQRDSFGATTRVLSVGPSLAVLVPDSPMGAEGLRRRSATALIEAARASGAIMIIDGGPLLASTAAVEFATGADAIVLVVNVRRQDTNTLSTVSRLLTNVRDRVLVVSTSGSRPMRKQRSASIPSVSSAGVDPLAPGSEASSPTAESDSKRFTWQPAYDDTPVGTQRPSQEHAPAGTPRRP